MRCVAMRGQNRCVSVAPARCESPHADLGASAVAPAGTGCNKRVEHAPLLIQFDPRHPGTGPESEAQIRPSSLGAGIGEGKGKEVCRNVAQ